MGQGNTMVNWHRTALWRNYFTITTTLPYVSTKSGFRPPSWRRNGNGSSQRIGSKRVVAYLWVLLPRRDVIRVEPAKENFLQHSPQGLSATVGPISSYRACFNSYPGP